MKTVIQRCLPIPDPETERSYQDQDMYLEARATTVHLVPIFTEFSMGDENLCNSTNELYHGFCYGQTNFYGT